MDRGVRTADGRLRRCDHRGAVHGPAEIPDGRGGLLLACLSCTETLPPNWLETQRKRRDDLTLLASDVRDGASFIRVLDPLPASEAIRIGTGGSCEVIRRYESRFFDGRMVWLSGWLQYPHRVGEPVTACRFNDSW